MKGNCQEWKVNSRVVILNREYLAELIRYAFCDCLNTDNYPKDVENSAVYTRELVQQCFDRRKAIADQFCQNIRADMLNGMR